MANSHPYISGPGNIALMITHLRKSFPQKITSETVKKLGIASNNESHVINVLHFIDLINEEGTKTEMAGKIFSNHKDEDFAKAFSEVVKKSYSGLFDLHGESSWTLENDDLITFFRQSDQTSDAIGKRQAGVFRVFSSICGHTELPLGRPATSTKSKIKKEPKKISPSNIDNKKIIDDIKPTPNSNKDIGLTVRIEINLPANGNKETYDNIFKSIKENLINA